MFFSNKDKNSNKNSHIRINKNIKNIDSESYREYSFKRNVFLISLSIFVFFLSFFLYILLKKDIIFFDNDNEEQPLRIVVPYPNNPINTDDYEIIKYEIQFGDNLSSILTNSIGITNGEANNIINVLKKIYNPAKLKAGEILDIKYRIVIGEEKNNEVGEKIVVENIRFNNVDKENEINVFLDENNNYVANITKVVLNRHLLKYKVKINDNLFSDGLNAGVPTSVMFEFIRIFSFDIDFQRDLRKGDIFEVLFEGLFNENGEKVRDGDILYASLNNNGKIFNMYKFNKGYYDENGQSVQKSLLKTPINGARISSNFGVRRHPILGYTKKHEGKDFAAPSGTPFFASGSGVVVKSGPNGSFGNYVRIKHIGGYETEYAHASVIAKGIKNGVRVKQGQTIAFVGTTGRSTGPHLHYGVIYNGKRVNPDRIKSLPTIKLTSKNIEDFNIEKDKINLIRNSIPNQSNKKYKSN
jgi:murein DD-endopeptidase MepM/ murein hydrolase activator NlpD